MNNLNDILNLENKNALITGATGGIGEAIAFQFAQLRMNLCLTGRNESKLKKIKKNLEKLSPKIEIITANLADEEQLKKIVDFYKKNYSTLDILVHSAGVILTGPAETASVEGLKLHLGVNYVAPFIITKSLLPVIRESKGQIVFVNSSAIQRPIGNLGQYTSSKFALKGLADSLREEVNADGIRILSIYPGKTATTMQKNLYHQANKRYIAEKLLQPEDVAIAILNAILMPMTAEITEIFIRPMQKS